MSLHEIPLEFQSPNGTRLRGRMALPADAGESSPLPVVLMLTGDGTKGTKSETWTNLPPRLASKGVASFLFDFSGLGFSDGDKKHLTLTKGLAEARSAINILMARPEIDKSRIGIFGSSFGGNIAILAATHFRELRCLGLKSPVSFYPDSLYLEFGAELIEQWARLGYVKEIGFDYPFYIDAMRHNTYAAAMTITCPCLITHGSNDNVVPITQSRHLLAALERSSSRLSVYEGVGHHYSEPGAWECMATEFTDWFIEQLTDSKKQER